MDLDDMLERVSSREDLARFVATLCRDLDVNPAGWENLRLDMFLDALSRWLADSEREDEGFEDAPPDGATWRFLGLVLLAAKVYE